MNFMPPTAGTTEHNGDAWTDEQIMVLARLVRDHGLSNAEAAVRMGRTESSISSAASRFNVRNPDAQLRPCLTCYGRLFFSAHKGNRICDRCRRREELECA